MSKLKHKSNLRRKTKYDLLRNAGFNSREANRYKDMRDIKITNLVDAKKANKLELDKIVGDFND